MTKHEVKIFSPIPRFCLWPSMPKNENEESAENFIKFLPTLLVIFTD